MAELTFDEYVDETKMLDVENNTYRVFFWSYGKITQIVFSEYVDAERAGFAGYVKKVINLPTSLVRQIAADLPKE